MVMADVMRFLDDDLAYLNWLASNPTGWVVNSNRTASSGYLVLHRSTCYTITGTPARGSTWTEGDFAKTCSTDQGALRHWCQANTGAQPHPCGSCHP